MHRRGRSRGAERALELRRHARGIVLPWYVGCFLGVDQRGVDRVLARPPPPPLPSSPQATTAGPISGRGATQTFPHTFVLVYGTKRMRSSSAWRPASDPSALPSTGRRSLPLRCGCVPSCRTLSTGAANRSTQVPTHILRPTAVSSCIAYCDAAVHEILPGIRALRVIYHYPQTQSTATSLLSYVAQPMQPPPPASASSAAAIKAILRRPSVREYIAEEHIDVSPSWLSPPAAPPLRGSAVALAPLPPVFDAAWSFEGDGGDDDEAAFLTPPPPPVHGVKPRRLFQKKRSRSSDPLAVTAAAPPRKRAKPGALVSSGIPRPTCEADGCAKEVKIKNGRYQRVCWEHALRPATSAVHVERRKAIRHAKKMDKTQ
jgi:hypothetical protein